MPSQPYHISFSAVVYKGAWDRCLMLDLAGSGWEVPQGGREVFLTYFESFCALFGGSFYFILDFIKICPQLRFPPHLRQPSTKLPILSPASIFGPRQYQIRYSESILIDNLSSFQCSKITIYSESHPICDVNVCDLLILLRPIGDPRLCILWTLLS
jgi:hypothetical protein